MYGTNSLRRGLFHVTKHYKRYENGRSSIVTTRIFRQMSHWSGEEFSVPVPWGKIAGRKWGDPNGHPWIATHGWLDNAGTFDKLAPLFPKNHLLYCIDFPGHGYSSHIPEGHMYHFMEGVIYIQRVARHLKLEKYGLIGHSFGGAISMLSTGINPEPVSHLISIDLIRPYTSEPKNTVDSALNSINSLFTIEEKSRSEEKKVYDYGDISERLQNALNTSNNEPHDMKEVVEILLKRGLKKSDCGKGFTLNRDSRHLVPTIQRLTIPLYMEMLKRIQVPHLIIKANNSTFYGEKDEVMEVVHFLESNNPKFLYEVVDGIHHVHLHDPQKVISPIETFLGKYPI